MVITVAGERLEVPEGTTVARLIELRQVENAAYVTVSVNEEFVDSADLPTRVLQAGDTVEFLYFMGGGQGGGR